MAFKSFKTIKSPDRVVTQVQQNISEALSPILNKEVLGGRLIESVIIVSGTAKRINHGLDRKYKGWIVVDQNANANIWSSVSSLPEKTLILNSSATVTVSIWVF